jgi:hypothetical protein
MDDGKNDDAPPPPRQTYMPKPPSKEEVDQVSREQGMISDEWTGEPSASEAEDPADETGSPEGSSPGEKGGGG